MDVTAPIYASHSDFWVHLPESEMNSVFLVALALSVSAALRQSVEVCLVGTSALSRQSATLVSFREIALHKPCTDRGFVFGEHIPLEYQIWMWQRNRRGHPIDL